MSVLGGATNLNYNIGGQLPFQSAGNPIIGTAQIGAGLGLPAGVQQGLGTLANQYGQSYQAALAQNQALYGNILQGYQQLMGNQVANQKPIEQGYQALGSQVQGMIQGVGASEAQNIQDVYAQQAGQASQGLINRGLGNATVTNSVQRGLTLDEQKAQVALANQMAQLQAGYASNIGMAGLNYANQANMQNTALGAQELGWMNTVQAQYPNPQEYNALFGQAGQFNQANLDRQLLQQLGTTRGNPFGGGGGGGGQGGIHVQQMPPVNWGSGLGPQDYGGYGALMGGYSGGGGGFGGMANMGYGAQPQSFDPSQAAGAPVPAGAQPFSADQNGNPVYAGNDGNLYYSDGTPADPNSVFGDQSQGQSNFFGPYAGGMAEQGTQDQFADPFAAAQNAYYGGYAGATGFTGGGTGF